MAQHVKKHKDGWQVIRDGGEKATHVTETQKEAIDIARAIAINQKTELFIHGEDGKVRESHNYAKSK